MVKTPTTLSTNTDIINQIQEEISEVSENIDCAAALI